MFQALRISGWCIAAVAYTVAGGAVLFAAVFFTLTPVGWVLSPFGVMFLMNVRKRLSRRRAAVVMGYIEQAMRLNLPLRPMIEAAAVSETGTLRDRLTSLADRLELGEPVWRAVREGTPEMPYRAVVLLERAERIGRLPEMVARLRDEDRVRANQERAVGSAGWTYPIMVICVTLFMVTLFGLLIAPKFREIFEDFEVALPVTTLRMFDFSAWLVHGGGASGLLPGWVLVACIFLLFAMAWIAWQAGFARELARPVLWYLPVTGAMERNRGLGDVCFVLEESVKAGVSMDVALNEAAALDLNPVLRWRVEAWQERAETGESLPESAKQAGLPRLVSGMIEVGQTSGALGDALGFLRRFYDSRSSALAAFLQSAAGPAAILVLGLLVGWVVVSMFLPLVTLIEQMNGIAEWGMP